MNVFWKDVDTDQEDPAGKEGACISRKDNPLMAALVFKSH